MKVLHVIPGVSFRYGGPSAAIRAICESLSASGLDVELAATTANGPGCELNGEEQIAVEREFPHPVHLFPRKRSEQWKYSPQLAAWLQANVARFDLVHIHALWSYASQAASRIARYHRVPTIIRPAGMLSDYTFEHGVWKKKLYWNLIEKHTVRRASAIHATSTAEREDALKRCPGANIHIIANGVNNDAWAEPRVENLKQSRPQILFLSRLHPKKGITDYLLPAFEKMRLPATLKIAGGIDPHLPQFADEVRRAVDLSPRKADIEMLGEIRPADRWHLFDQASLFVLPSHSENFGIVVAEAFARKCAVVVTDRVQSCEHVIAANAGAVVPLDVDQIATAMDRMLSDSIALNTMACRGQEYAKSHFSWPAIAQQIIGMYESCLTT